MLILTLISVRHHSVTHETVLLCFEITNVMTVRECGSWKFGNVQEWIFCTRSDYTSRRYAVAISFKAMLSVKYIYDYLILASTAISQHGQAFVAFKKCKLYATLERN